jgi:hypothetical protein
LRYFTRASLVLAVGISIGVVVGWLVFSLSTLTGKPLFIVGGGLIGLVIAAIGLAYNRGSAFLTLSEMTINFPQLGEMKFAINSEYRRVAWKLFVETLTRISTQPLESEDGSLREALSSLYSLFNATRAAAVYLCMVSLNFRKRRSSSLNLLFDMAFKPIDYPGASANDTY